MDQRQIISPSQLSWLATVIIFTSSQTFFPREALYISGHNGWIAYTVPLFYALFITFIFYELSKRFPEKNIFEISQQILGKVMGGIINFIILAYIWISLIRNIAILTAFMDSSILISTPIYIIGIIITLMIIYYGKMSYEVSARVNELTFLLFIGMAFTMPLMLIGDIQPERLLPILAKGIDGFVKSNTLTIGWFGDIFILGAFLHALSVPKQIHAAIRFGLINATFILTLVMVLTITVLGPNIGSKATYPIYLLAEQIHFTDFLERLEIIMVTAYTFSFMLNMIFMFIAGLIGLSSYTNRKDYRIYSTSVGWFLYMFKVLSFSSITELYIFSSYSSVVITLVLQVPILIILLVFSRRKKFKKKQSNIVKKEHKYARRWRWSTNGLILMGILFIFFGILFGRDFSICGLIAGIGFALCLTSALVTSFMEMIKCNKLRQNST
ncbi:GerAB/ArcD/ProY family transporter [Chengkuizengella sediminis]|uniref:GerAB/ArcD/ProY family transporter n=1 Tax=Chengkuizengella sediminis TaxID=1885917 RepID=UPI00138945D7|nr:endospore germination permease [Chengkuizengella sediminis]NDI34723.1 endospore germination permease [Chengkuizengella sediminis]